MGKYSSKKFEIVNGNWLKQTAFEQDSKSKSFAIKIDSITTIHGEQNGGTYLPYRITLIGDGCVIAFRYQDETEFQKDLKQLESLLFDKAKA